RFRSDLYYRLNVIAIELPPLRSRREDIPIFVKAFLERIAQEHGLEPKQLAPQAQEVIMAYDWPGNVRELENALERAAVLTKGDTIELATLPEKLSERRAEPLVSERVHPNPTPDVIERAYITWVLESDGVYVVLGQAIAQGDGYRSIHLVGAPLQVRYPPALPLLLAVPWALAGTLGAVRATVAVLHPMVTGAAAGLVWWLGRRQLPLSP